MNMLILAIKSYPDLNPIFHLSVNLKLPENINDCVVSENAAELFPLL